MEDQRAHERINKLEDAVQALLERHERLENNLMANTAATQQIAQNTKEIIVLFQGFKGIRGLVIWFTPIAVAALALYGWIKHT